RMRDPDVFLLLPATSLAHRHARILRTFPVDHISFCFTYPDLHHGLLTVDQGTGEAYCLAHHLTVDGGKRRLMIAALRYYDTFAKLDGTWLFSERLLYVDWIEERVVS